jgi:hypothetical protein
MFGKNVQSRIQKRYESVPGTCGGTGLCERRWDAKSLQVPWNVETRSPALKSMAQVLIQALRLHRAGTGARSAREALLPVEV